jgi:hypothetical protein
MPGTLHITHASLSWRDDDKVTERDMHAAFRRQAAFATFTEVFGTRTKGNEGALRRIAKEYGYTVVEAPGNDAVCVADGVKVVDHGGPLVNPAQKGAPPHDGHSARHAPWVLAEVLDEKVMVVEGHWVTGLKKDAERRKEHAKMSEVIAGLVREHGQGSQLAFWTGDINAADKAGVNPGFEILHAAGLVTCWDELGVWPATHGGKDGATIDIIGSYAADKRVSCKSARSWPKVESDHNPISAWYDIAQPEDRAPFRVGQRVEGMLPATVLEVRREPEDGPWVVTVDADDFINMDGANLRPLRGLNS